jgi:phage shock protein PspC (stress-responsive transcriptional regulator)
MVKAKKQANKRAEVKRLCKSKDKLLDGVIGGFAEYLTLDPTIARLIFVILVLVTGIVPGIILYILAAIIMPNRTY